MNLYIVRHGETSWNKDKKIQGLTDIELNEKGIMQANEMKEKLKDISFDLCISSPLKRARKTAEIIVDGKCNITIDELLIERCFGIYEGEGVNNIDIDFLKLWDYKENYSNNNIEPMRTLLKRADMFKQILKDKYNAYSDVLIVSHGGLIKGLYYSINGYDENTDFLSFHLGNCEVYKCNI